MCKGRERKFCTTSKNVRASALLPCLSWSELVDSACELNFAFINGTYIEKCNVSYSPVYSCMCTSSFILPLLLVASSSRTWVCSAGTPFARYKIGLAVQKKRDMQCTFVVLLWSRLAMKWSVCRLHVACIFASGWNKSKCLLVIRGECCSINVDTVAWSDQHFKHSHSQ